MDLLALKAHVVARFATTDGLVGYKSTSGCQVCAGCFDRQEKLLVERQVLFDFKIT